MSKYDEITRLMRHAASQSLPGDIFAIRYAATEAAEAGMISAEELTQIAEMYGQLMLTFFPGTGY